MSKSALLLDLSQPKQSRPTSNQDEMNQRRAIFKPSPLFINCISFFGFIITYFFVFFGWSSLSSGGDSHLRKAQRKYPK